MEFKNTLRLCLPTPQPFVFNVVDVVLLPPPPPQILVYSSAVGMSELRRCTVRADTSQWSFKFTRI